MNRKSTFAKRQRETDLKDHARAKAARSVAREQNSRTGKGPAIDWNEMVQPEGVALPDDAYATLAAGKAQDAVDNPPPPPAPAPAAPATDTATTTSTPPR